MTVIKVRWDYTSNTNEQMQPDYLKIYPNPVPNGIFHIQKDKTWDINEDLKLRLRDINGRICYEQNHVNIEEGVNISQLPAGYYLLELLGQRRHYLGKIVVQNK